jgi:YidC/Oxa1 family membrane protein insertase
MDKESNRNTIIFMVCALVLVFGYQTFILGPAAKRQQAAAQAQAAAMARQHPAAQTNGLAAPGNFMPRAQVVAQSPRLPVDTPSLAGSINLRGAVIDDLNLKTYHQTVDAKSPPVELLRPAGVEHAWFADVGWTGANVPGIPDLNTIWTATPGARLTPTSPVALTYDNGHGLVFHRLVAVDDHYMFAISDTVTNSTGQPVVLQAYGSVQQRGLPADLANSNIIHEGAIGILGGVLKQSKYKSWKKDGVTDYTSTGGWLGITQKYWLTALIPDQSMPIKGEFRVMPVDNVDNYEVGYLGPQQTIAPGASLTQTTHVFAGAKVVPMLKGYETSIGAPKFDQAVDWGNFWFLTRPLFDVLEFLNHALGSIALAILALTVLLKAVLFPLANKSYESISKMKKIQPQIEALKKQHDGDQTALQQATMQLYQQEKINPLMGCLPMLVQIPVFYSLYKVLSVTIEMRQAPFFGWIHDLSTRDPTSIWTLFGLIPWNPAHLAIVGTYLDGPLHIGLWPMIYGFTMWLSQAMNPPAADPMQQRIFALMPLIFTFTLSQFTVGLLIYWTWSNLLSILQQYFIMHRFGVDNPIDSVINRFRAPKAQE